EGDVELTADIFEELDEEHRTEFLKSRSDEEAARVLDRMAPDDAADLLGELDQERRLPVLNMMSNTQQLKLRKLLQYDPTSAGADIVEVTLMMADYNLTALGVTDGQGNLIGAISVDDLIQALIPDDWRSRVEASSGV